MMRNAHARQNHAKRPPSGKISFSEETESSGYEHIAFHIPISYSAPDSLILHGLRLDVALSSEGEVEPIVIYMQPQTNVKVEEQKLGQFGIDIGKAISVLVPQMPPIFTASANAEIDIERVKPRVLASGVQRHNCSWRVADSRIAYGFNPALMAQFSHTLTATISLHVEIRKRILGIFYKTYAKSARPMTYTYRTGQALMTAYDYAKRIKEAGLEEVFESGAKGSEAFYELGKRLEEHNPSGAEAWFLRAAEAGNVAAMVRLAQRNGRENRIEAIKWYTLAAESGHTGAMIMLGDLTRQQDEPAVAESWYQRAANEGGRIVMLRLARHFDEQQDYHAAEKWYTVAADAGDATAMHRLARLSEEKAKMWYERAANAGDIPAMLRLGEFGEASGDRAVANFWYQKAADLGSYKAHMHLKRVRSRWRFILPLRQEPKDLPRERAV